MRFPRPHDLAPVLLAALVLGTAVALAAAQEKAKSVPAEFLSPDGVELKG